MSSPLSCRILAGLLLRVVLLVVGPTVADRLSVNPYNIPMGGGTCGPGTLVQATGCGVGSPGTPVTPGSPPPVCANVAPPGYPGPVIAMQSHDPDGDCYIITCPGNMVLNAADVCMRPEGMEGPLLPTVPCHWRPLCADDAPPDYAGPVIQGQSLVRCGQCFEGTVCADDALHCHAGPVISMQSTDPGALCYELPSYGCSASSDPVMWYGLEELPPITLIDTCWLGLAPTTMAVLFRRASRATPLLFAILSSKVLIPLGPLPRLRRRPRAREAGSRVRRRVVCETAPKGNI